MAAVYANTTTTTTASIKIVENATLNPIKLKTRPNSTDAPEKSPLEILSGNILPGHHRLWTQRTMTRGKGHVINRKETHEGH